MTTEPQDDGLREKFLVQRIHPSSRGIDHTGCRYFVLDPQHDPTARRALSVYARTTPYGALAKDLIDWLDSIDDSERGRS